MALTDTLNKPLSKPLTSGERYEQAIAQPLEQMGAAQQELGEFEAIKAEDVARRESERAQKKAASTRGLVEEIQTSPERGMLRETESELMNAAFVPSQDNAQDLAGLFSLINVIGFAIGRGGKNNAMQAMSAMNGMAEGYQKGRADLYKKEKDQFDESMKTLKTKSDILTKRLSEIADLATKNKQAADEEADVLFAQEGADFLRQYKAKYGLGATVEFWKQVAQAKSKAAELTEKEISKKAEQSAAMQRTKLEIAGRASEGALTRENQREIERMKESSALEKLTEQLDAKARYQLLDQVFKKQRDERQAELKEKLQTLKGNMGGGLKPSSKVVEGYIADMQLKTDLGELANDLKDQKLKDQIKQYRAEAFLTEEGKVLNQFISSDIPPELKSFLNKVRQVRNNYYLNISGKAVTGGEALRNYGVVPQPGDSPEDIAIKIKSMEDNVEGNIDTKRQLFKLPEIKRKALQPTSLVPGQDYNTADSPSSGNLTPEEEAELKALKAKHGRP